MAISVGLTPGRRIRWRRRSFVVVDCNGFDSIIAREVGKRGLERIPVDEARPEDESPRAVYAGRLESVSDKEWQKAVKQFGVLKPLFEMSKTERTRAHVEKVAKIVGRHPATVYRWIDAYNRAQRLSVFLRKGRSDRGRSRLSASVNAVIEAAIKEIYLTAEQPPISAVIEEVELRCFKAKLKKPAANTVRRRVAMLSDRLKLQMRKGKRAAAAKYEPIKGHFPGAEHRDVN